jgi:hypothetical protein
MAHNSSRTQSAGSVRSPTSCEVVVRWTGRCAAWSPARHAQRRSRSRLHRFHIGADEAGTIEQRLDRVALETVGLLAQAGDDHPPLTLDRHLAAEDQMRTLTRLAAQLRSGSLTDTEVRLSTKRRVCACESV